ncbi:MAG: F0F1 ATP synthase subunit A [Phycisphaerales bacterium]|nr:F0F1 ATP synthase subunit A [Phycisphaerales bacterium]
MLGLLLASDNPLSHVVQHTAWDLNPGGPLALPIISNHIIMQVLAGLLLIWLMPRFVRQRAGGDEVGVLTPRGFGNAIEAVCVGMRDSLFKPNLGRYTDAFAPYLWSLFFFLFTCNILGMIPIADLTKPFTGHLLGGTSTGNIWVTGTLATLTLILIVYNGLRFHGMAYVKHFFMGPAYLAWFIAILEIMGLLFKTLALAVRLFANMLAGHILLAVLFGFVEEARLAFGVGGGLGIGFAVVLISVPIYFLEILVAFLHAFIFTVLTAVFIGQAVNIHHDDHEHDHDHGSVAAH